MIIFGLEGVLADDSHRRHFIDWTGSHPDYYRKPCESCKDGSYHMIDPQFHKVTGKIWEPDYTSYEAACGDDKPINEVIKIYNALGSTYGQSSKLHIWSYNCESMKEKTLKWIYKNIGVSFVESRLKMRPIGDTTPAHELKERWLDESYKHVSLNTDNGITTKDCHDIDMVFESDPETIAMFRKRGIFMFDCNQDK